MGSPTRIKWTLYIIIAFIFIFLSLTDIGSFYSFSRTKLDIYSSEETPEKYVIIIDGGSTGSRIHVYGFINDLSGLLTLKDELTIKTTPGLSSFALVPSKAAESVAVLLERAKDFVPVKHWDETPVTVIATAGLRLLPHDLSHSILKEVSKTLEQSPFMSDENSVSILDGESEGLFAWYSLNFLLGRLNNPHQAAAAIDLGGGSTQVTFLPIDFDTLVLSPKNYIVNSKFNNQSFSLYTHSYLGLGVMAARLSMLKLETENKDSNSSFSTCCLPPGKKALWKYDFKEYIVRGTKKEEYSFENCYEKAVRFLSDVVDQPEELWKKEIYALAFYYKRAAQMGVVGRKGGVATVGAFIDACKAICKQTILPKWSACLDCSYISALFSHGLGFHRNKEINFATEIDKKDLSWSVGAAINLLH